MECQQQNILLKKIFTIWLVFQHTDNQSRKEYFLLLKEAKKNGDLKKKHIAFKAFKEGDAQPLRYAKMRDRLLVEEGKEQLFGTQWKFENSKRLPHPIKEPEYVDKRRAEIGLGPLSIYLKERFDIEWNIEQEK